MSFAPEILRAAHKRRQARSADTFGQAPGCAQRAHEFAVRSEKMADDPTGIHGGQERKIAG